MDAIIPQILDIAKGVDDAARKKMVTDLRNLSIALEDGDDTLQRLVYAPLHLYGAWIGSSLTIFDILCRAGTPVSVEALARETRADPVLLRRLLRYMGSVKLCDEVSCDEFTANNVSRVLATPRGRNYLDLYFNTVNSIFDELPRFLEKTEYQNPFNESKTAFQDAYNFDGTIYAWWQANPSRGAVFSKHMEYRREGGADWLDVFPIDRYAASCDPGSALFVDLGGGIGHQCARLKAAYPTLSGRVILQDLPYVIEGTNEAAGIERMVQDLFEPQPIRDARMYYLRGVLHCFTDEKCIEILGNTRAAMGAASCILIDEAVLPDTGVFWQATQQDLLMMASMASVERSRSQWETLLASVGLKIAEVHVYSQTLYESVIVAVLDS